LQTISQEVYALRENDLSIWWRTIWIIWRKLCTNCCPSHVDKLSFYEHLKMFFFCLTTYDGRVCILCKFWPKLMPKIHCRQSRKRCMPWERSWTPCNVPSASGSFTSAPTSLDTSTKSTRCDIRSQSHDLELHRQHCKNLHNSKARFKNKNIFSLPWILSSLLTYIHTAKLALYVVINSKVVTSYILFD
jgi:hypothetical protein